MKPEISQSLLSFLFMSVLILWVNVAFCESPAKVTAIDSSLHTNNSSLVAAAVAPRWNEEFLLTAAFPVLPGKMVGSALLAFGLIAIACIGYVWRIKSARINELTSPMLYSEEELSSENRA